MFSWSFVSSCFWVGHVTICLDLRDFYRIELFCSISVHALFHDGSDIAFEFVIVLDSYLGQFGYQICKKSLDQGDLQPFSTEPGTPGARLNQANKRILASQIVTIKNITKSYYFFEYLKKRPKTDFIF